jgi:hypothetical protein
MSRNRPSLHRAEPTVFHQETDGKGHVLHVHSATVTPHKFAEQAQLGLPAWCDCCEKFIFSRKLARCSACNVTVHRTCVDAFVRLHSCPLRSTDAILSRKSKPASNTPPATTTTTTTTTTAASGGKPVVALSRFWASRLHFDPQRNAVPDAVEQMVGWLHAHNAVGEEGIFRLSGATSVVDEISRRFAAGEPLALDSFKALDAHDVASALKRWFRELPEPICTFELYDAFIAATELVLAKKTSAASIDVLRSALGALPPGCLATLRALFKLLTLVAQNAARNKMTPSNLAIVFAPGLLRTNTNDPLVSMMGMQRASQFVELLIVNWATLDDDDDDDDDATETTEDDSGDIVHSATEVELVSTEAAEPVLHVAKVAETHAVVVPHHADVLHLPAVPQSGSKSPKLHRTAAVPSVMKPLARAPLPPQAKLVRMPSDRTQRLREKAQLIKQVSDRSHPPDAPSGHRDETEIKKIESSVTKLEAAAAHAESKAQLAKEPSEQELHRWASVMLVIQGDAKAEAAAVATAAAATTTTTTTAATAVVVNADSDDDDDDDDDDNDIDDMFAPPPPPELDAASEKSLEAAFQTLIDVASVRIATRALQSRKVLGDMAKSGETTIAAIAEHDPYTASNERKLAERFPGAAEQQIKLALRLANNDLESAAQAIASNVAAATGAASPVAAPAPIENNPSARRPSKSRIDRSKKANAIKRAAVAAIAPAGESELVSLVQLLERIANSDTDLAVWVEREARANPKPSEADEDGVWRGLPADVAKAIKLCESLFAQAERNIDTFMSQLSAVSHTRSHDALFDDMGHLLRLVERNAERRALNVQTMIRAKQGALKAQDLWLFSGDRSKRIQSALKQRQELMARRAADGVGEGNLSSLAKEDKQ